LLLDQIFAECLSRNQSLTVSVFDRVAKIVETKFIVFDS